ncbi:hypothetical protein [Roseivivax sp. CAU 1761]
MGPASALCTFCKYLPSRANMVLAAPEHRPGRGLSHLVDACRMRRKLPERVGASMATEPSHGCLFPGAVAADPGRDALRGVLARHEAEMARRAAGTPGPGVREIDPPVILEGFK